MRTTPDNAPVGDPTSPDPGATTRPGAAGHGPGGAGQPWWGDDTPRTLGGAVLLSVGSALLAGIATGLGWAAIAPTARAVVGSGSYTISETEVGRMFGAEGVFALLAVLAGLVAAIAGRGWVQRSGPLAVVGLAVAGLVGSIAAWRVGVWAGPDPVAARADLALGDLVETPLRLRSTGLLLMWPITTTFVTMWIAVVSVTAAPPEGADAAARPAGDPAPAP